MSAFAQSVVQGTVKDKSGEPLIGATIQIKGQQGGTVTDLDGVWKLSDLKPGQTIVLRGLYQQGDKDWPTAQVEHCA